MTEARERAEDRDERDPRAGVASGDHEPRDDAADDGDSDPDARIDALARECEELRAQWQRAQADYQNLRRRLTSDVETGVKRALQPLLEDFLLVIDHLDMALAAPVHSDDAKALAQGVQLTRRQLASALENQSVEPIPETGRFDPERHQAVTQIPSPDHPPGAIVETIRRGYTWRGGVLRHAQVVVAAEPPARAARGDVPMEDR